MLLLLSNIWLAGNKLAFFLLQETAAGDKGAASGTEDFSLLKNGARKLYLKDKEGKVLGFMIIPLKQNKSLMVAPDELELDKKVWNEKTKKEEELF